MPRYACVQKTDESGHRVITVYDFCGNVGGFFVLYSPSAVPPAALIRKATHVVGAFELKAEAAAPGEARRGRDSKKCTSNYVTYDPVKGSQPRVNQSILGSIAGDVSRILIFSGRGRMTLHYDSIGWDMFDSMFAKFGGSFHREADG